MQAPVEIVDQILSQGTGKLQQQLLLDFSGASQACALFALRKLWEETPVPLNRTSVGRTLQGCSSNKASRTTSFKLPTLQMTAVTVYDPGHDYVPLQEELGPWLETISEHVTKTVQVTCSMALGFDGCVSTLSKFPVQSQFHFNRSYPRRPPVICSSKLDQAWPQARRVLDTQRDLQIRLADNNCHLFDPDTLYIPSQVESAHITLNEFCQPWTNGLSTENLGKCIGKFVKACQANRTRTSSKSTDSYLEVQSLSLADEVKNFEGLGGLNSKRVMSK
jgi:hypothetical protein